MHEEKKIGSLRWLSCGNLKFRIKKVDDDTSVVWISKSDANLCFSLILYDFLDHCSEILDIEIDFSWKRHRGFKVKSSGVDILLGEIINFINEWEIEPNEKMDKFTNSEWYSD